MKIYRFSDDGFVAKKQTHLDNKIKESLEHEKLLSLCLNDYMKTLVQKSISEKSDPFFQTEGIFVFLFKPSNKDFNYYLNHLNEKERKTKKLNIADINENAICYIDDGFPYREKNKMTIKEAFNKHHNVIYIPKSELKYINKLDKKRKQKI